MRKEILERAKLLIVDDQESNIRLLERLLGLGGYAQLISTMDPREALPLFHQHKPDLILLDLIMPHMDGFAVLEQLAPFITGDTYLPVLVLTADISSEAKQRALAMGAKDFITKPIDAIEVLLRINNLLEARFLHLELEARVAERTEALHQLSARLLQLQDEERRRISRELHDDTSQNLAAISMMLGKLMEPDGTLSPSERATLSESIELLRACTQSIRTLCYVLHPPLLEEVGLASALRTFARGFSERTGIAVDLDVPEHFPRLAQDLELALFRVAQEGLSNVHRHSGSATARLRLVLEAGEVRLELVDAGRGIAEGSDLLGIGIAGMRERARLLGGQLDIVSGEQGTTVSLRLLLGATAL